MNIFFSAKKCVNKDCLTYGPPRLSDDGIMHRKHLPNPMPSDDSKHYKAFDKVIGTETDESHMPSLKTTKNRKHIIPFNPLQQHALNTRLVIEYSECDKLHVIFAQKKLTPQEIKSFKHITSSLFYTCGASLQEFKGQVHNPCESVLDKTFVKENHSCIKPIETIYYSCKIYPDRCTWCSSKRKLTTTPNSFPICSACKAANKKTVLKKRQRKHIE